MTSRAQLHLRGASLTYKSNQFPSKSCQLRLISGSPGLFQQERSIHFGSCAGWACRRHLEADYCKPWRHVQCHLGMRPWFRVSGLGHIWVRLVQNGTNPAPFRLDFSTFLLVREFLAHWYKMNWNLIWNSLGFVQFAHNLAHFRAKIDIPASINLLIVLKKLLYWSIETIRDFSPKYFYSWIEDRYILKSVLFKYT